MPPRAIPTSTVPAVWAGVVAVIVVELTSVTLVAAVPPKVAVGTEGARAEVSVVVTATGTVDVVVELLPS